MSQDYLAQLEVVRWQKREMESTSSMPSGSCWDALNARVAACTQCQLHTTRTQTVFGVGNREAKLMVIGEAPGFYEDKQGEPFVGRAGQLLNAMLAAINHSRKDVYIANILKCRPPENRDPAINEVNACTPFLQEQMALIKPQLLLAVGRIAAHYLLQTKSSLESLRGRMHTFSETPLIITYHPAYLLRNPIDKRKAWIDLKLVQNTLQQLEKNSHGSAFTDTNQVLSTITS